MKKRILFFSENIRNKPLVKIFGLRNKSEYEPKNRKQKLCNNEEKLRNTTSNDFLMFLITVRSGYFPTRQKNYIHKRPTIFSQIACTFRICNKKVPLWELPISDFFQKLQKNEFFGHTMSESAWNDQDHKRQVDLYVKMYQKAFLSKIFLLMNFLTSILSSNGFWAQPISKSARNTHNHKS